MDKVVKNIQAGSSNIKDLKQLAEYLLKNEGAIAKNAGSIDKALEELDTKLHTLGYTILLSIKAQQEMEDVTMFISQCQRLFLNCSRDQALLMDSRFYFIANVFSIALTKLGLAIQGILPLKNALAVARPDDNTLTPIHADFLQLCILARCYNAALPVVKSTILSVVRSKQFTHTFYLRFHYYGGMVFLALKDYPNALHFFDRVVSARAVVLSAIMFEAYKKYILASLLVEGKAPSAKNSMVLRHLKALTQPYQEFATAYATKSVEDINKCVEANGEHFLKDKNLGLIRQCINTLYNNNIKAYTKTYLTLSLSGIAEGAKIQKIEDVESRLLRMIEKGAIYASVSQKDGIVSFSESQEKYDTSKTLNYLDSSIKNIIQLGDVIKFQDNKNALNFNYIQRTQMQEQRWEEQEDIGGERGMGGMFRG